MRIMWFLYSLVCFAHISYAMDPGVPEYISTLPVTEQAATCCAMISNIARDATRSKKLGKALSHRLHHLWSVHYSQSPDLNVSVDGHHLLVWAIDTGAPALVDCFLRYMPVPPSTVQATAGGTERRYISPLSLAIYKWGKHSNRRQYDRARAFQHIACRLVRAGYDSCHWNVLEVVHAMPNIGERWDIHNALF